MKIKRRDPEAFQFFDGRKESDIPTWAIVKPIFGWYSIWNGNHWLTIGSGNFVVRDAGKSASCRRSSSRRNTRCCRETSKRHHSRY